MRGRTNLPMCKKPGTSVLSWQPNALPITDDLIKVIYANDYFVAVGMGGTVVYSKDGVNWGYHSIGDYTLRDVTWSNSIYTIIGYNDACGVVVQTSNFVDWTTYDYTCRDGYRTVLTGVWFNGVKYIIMGAELSISSNHISPCIYTFSDSPLSRVCVTTLGPGQKVDVDQIACACGNNRMVMTFYAYLNSRFTQFLYVTSDGDSAREIRIIPPASENHLLYNSGYFYLSMNKEIRQSINAIDWETISGPSKRYICGLPLDDSAIFFSEHDMVVVLPGERLADKTADDARIISSSAVITSAAFGARKVVCVCKGGIIFNASIS